MSGSRPWEEVLAEMLARGLVTEEGIAQAEVERDAYLTGYRLAELRATTGMTQTQVAEEMGVSQARVSAIERGDIDALTLASIRAYVGALGGKVRLVASLGDFDVTLRLLDQAAAAQAVEQAAEQEIRRTA